MAKPTSRTAVMDEVPSPLKPKVRVNHHPVDWNTLAESVAERIYAFLNQGAKGCRYFNPAATVSCPSPTPEFFRLIRRVQSGWCRRAGGTIPRSARRSSSRWVSSDTGINSKHDLHLDRALCFTGVLFIDGKLVLPHNWPKSEEPNSTRVSMGRPV